MLKTKECFIGFGVASFTYHMFLHTTFCSTLYLLRGRTVPYPRYGLYHCGLRFANLIVNEVKKFHAFV